MTKAMRLFVLSGLFCAGLLAPSISAAELPDDVVFFGEVANATQSSASISALLWQVAPGAALPPLEQILTPLTRTSDAWTIDTGQPIQFVSVAPYVQAAPVVVFTSTDAQRYLDSLVPKVEHQRDEGGLHYYLETVGAAGEQPADQWDMPPANPLVIGVAGNRIVLGRSADAVRRVTELATDGSLPPGAHFEGADAGASVRVSRILQALEQAGANPFPAIKVQLGSLAETATAAQTQGVDLQELIGTGIDGLESILKQTRMLSATVTLGTEEYEAMFRLDPEPESGLAKYVAETPRGLSDLIRYAPADAFGAWTMNMGDLSPAIEWYERVLEAVVPAGSEDTVDIRKIGEAMRQNMAVWGDSIMFSASQSAEGPLVMVTATRVKDPVAAERFYRESWPEMMEEVSKLQKAVGVKFGLEASPEPIMYKGHKIQEWKFALGFEPPQMAGGQPMGAPQPAQMAAMQQAMVAQMWGADMRGYHTFVGDVYLYAQGGGALDRLEKVLDNLDNPGAGPDLMADVLQASSESTTAAGFLSVEKLANFYVAAMAKAFAEGGMGMMVPMFQALHFQVGKPVSFREQTTADGAVEEHVTLPLTTITNLVTGVQQAFMGQNVNVAP
jgi:hypothetical protein